MFEEYFVCLITSARSGSITLQIHRAGSISNQPPGSCERHFVLEMTKLHDYVLAVLHRQVISQRSCIPLRNVGNHQISHDIFFNVTFLLSVTQMFLWIKLRNVLIVMAHILIGSPACPVKPADILETSRVSVVMHKVFIQPTSCSIIWLFITLFLRYHVFIEYGVILCRHQQYYVNEPPHWFCWI